MNKTSDITVRLHETSSKFYSSKSSEAFERANQENRRLTKRLEKGEIVITDEMVFPPTMIYMPSPQLLTFMINRAAKAKR